MDDHTIDLGGVPVFYRRHDGGGGGGGEVLYLHSVPTSCDDWTETLRRTGGVAPDLPGFGRSGKAGNYDYSLPGYADFLEGLLDALALARTTIVGHGWGAAAALVFAQRHPERVDRLALVDPIPLLEGFEWPAIARWWRRPGIGELLMGSVSRWLLARQLRRGSLTAGAWPESRVDALWEQFDQGTQRAILRLHRSVDAASLAALGEHLGDLRQPSLIVWGDQDPWLSPAFAEAYGRRLLSARVQRIPAAGHWPWLDQPWVIDQLVSFAREAPPA